MFSEVVSLRRLELVTSGSGLASRHMLMSRFRLGSLTFDDAFVKLQRYTLSPNTLKTWMTSRSEIHNLAIPDQHVNLHRKKARCFFESRLQFIL